MFPTLHTEGMTRSKTTTIVGNREAFIPKFDPSKPIQFDENQRPTAGTAALVFQGLALRGGTNGDTGEKFENWSLIFACLSSTGRFKNIPVRANQNTLKISADKLAFTVPYIKKIHPLSAVPGLKNFADTTDTDWDELLEIIYPIRGLTYTGEMKLEVNPRNSKTFYSLDLSSLVPVLVGGKIHQMQRPESTQPEETDFDIE